RRIRHRGRREDQRLRLRRGRKGALKDLLETTGEEDGTWRTDAFSRGENPVRSELSPRRSETWGAAPEGLWAFRTWTVSGKRPSGKDQVRRHKRTRRARRGLA